MHPVEAYLAELSSIRVSGVPETSGYHALASLLNEVGRKLRPRIVCVINPRNVGAGIPDGGLYTKNQLAQGSTEPVQGQLPARGAIEVKAAGADALAVAHSEQVRRYLETYRQVLVTTYRDFALVGYDADGEPQVLERFSLAETEVAFWALAAHPGSDAAQQAGERLTDFLRRALLRQAQIAAPKDLAWFLASYAREARARAEERDLPNWASTRKALEEALGMSFSGAKGEHFFRSTLVQTLFYGLFAAWVFWAEHHPPADTQARFRWREAAGYLHIPILQKLFYDFSNPGALGTLHIDEVLDWAGEALDRVDRASFFSTFEQNHAVQYFYEPFLEAFDPELRKELGVWYTPPEIVKYMVARVDTVLREELDIADGLADPRVVVLDPCCGTGAYLVEVLNKIASTLAEKSGGVDALAAHEIKQAAMTRVYGFEILPAPFVISHLQIGMLLHRLGAPFADESDERAGVYLTNALTGWEPPTTPKQHLLFTEMEEERDKAQAVKQHAPILVILGNPPYNAYAGVSPDEEAELVEPYKEGLISEWGIKKFNLDELFVRFFGLAERRIGQVSKRGLVSFISSASWLSDPSFVVLRKHLLESFDAFWIEDLHGDRKSSEYAPDGRTSETIFAMAGQSAGIQQGVATSLWCRTGRDDQTCRVLYRDDIDDAKASDRRARLLGSLASPDLATEYVEVAPAAETHLAFRPVTTAPEYQSWPSVAELTCEPPSLGLLEKRGGAMIDIERAALVNRMGLYFDETRTLEDLPESLQGLKSNWARFNAAKTRNKVLSKQAFEEAKVRRMVVRPMDVQWAYVETTRPLWNEPRPRLVDQASQAGRYVLARRRAPRMDDGAPFLVSAGLCDEHALHKDAYLIPISLRAARASEDEQTSLLDHPDQVPKPNVSPAAAAFLEACGGIAEDMWMHVVSSGYAPAYLRENADGIRQDWPRIPLPATRDALLASAELGRTVAALLDVEEPVDAVTTGSIRHDLHRIGVPATTVRESGTLDSSAGDFAVTAGWGHAGKGGVTMPGRGRLVERPYTDAELAAFREGLADLGLTYDQLMSCLGGACYDVYLNDAAYWRCVPTRVWKYTIGGYQVMKKWLSYRERALLGRDLEFTEARHVTEMARRIAAILLLEPALDANYERVKADTYQWPQSSSAAQQAALVPASDR